MATQRFQQLAHWGAYTAVVEDGRFVACEPFANDPAPSPILSAMPSMVYSPTRIASPVVRRGWRDRRDRQGRGADDFVEVSWDEALRLVSSELARVRTTHGPASVFGGSYGWSSAGRYHHARTQVRRFLFSGGGCTDQLGNYSWGSAQFLLPHVIGTFEPVTGRVTDWNSVIAHTRLFIAFGGVALKNDQIASGGTGEHGLAGWLRKGMERGIEFVVVSPVRNDAPEFLGARWVPIRPNTDTAMMLGMAHTLLVEGRHDAAFLERCCTGFERFRRYLDGTADGVAKNAQWASAICGVPAETIVELARRSAGTRTLITLAWSLQRSHRGEQPYWTSIALAAMLGQIGLPGGGFAFGHGSMNGVGNPRPALPGPEVSMGSNPARSAIPVARLTDMLENPGGAYEFNGRHDHYPDIRLVYWAGGNPFHHHQDLNRLRRAWARPETVIVHDAWWTPTARQADIVLPATTSLERNDIGASSRDRYVFAMQRAIAPVGGARNDVDVFGELAERGGYAQAYSQGRDENTWLRAIWSGMQTTWSQRGAPLPDFDEFWRRGWVEMPAPARDYVLFEEFRHDPASHPLRTPSGKIEIYSETVASFGYDDCPPHPSWVPPAEWLGAPAASRYPLHLVSNQPADKLHSQMDPGPVAQAKKIAGREPLHIHPRDAAQRGLADGAIARVFNDRGACLAGVRIDEGLLPGTVMMATGAWFDVSADGLELGGNPNVLSFDAGTSRLTQGSSALSALVEVEAWAGEAPPSRAYRPPRIVPA